MCYNHTICEKCFHVEMGNGNASEDREYLEKGLPGYLQHDLDAYKRGLVEGSSLMDCLWCELYGSINGAEIDDRAITHEHAEYLRDKYLRGELSWRGK